MSFADLRLTLPQQQLNADHHLVVRFKDVMLEKLSDPDLFISQVETVNAQLHNLNRSNLAGDTRFNLMAPVMNRYLMVLHQLRKKAKGSVLSELNKEMAYACKLLIRDCPPSGPEEKAQLFHWAMIAMIEQVRDHYEKYLSEPKGVWGELHRLYEQAYLQKLTQNTNAPMNRSIEQSYKQALMLAAGEPHHLSVKENRQLFYWLGSNADKIYLNRQESRDLNQNYYYIDLARNESVLNHRQIGDVGNDQTILCLNPLSLINLAKEHMKAIRQGSPVQRMGFAQDMDAVDAFLLIRKALQAWAHTTSRRYERENCHMTAELAIGLHQIHGVLKQAAKSGQLLVNATMVNKSKAGACMEMNGAAHYQPNVGDVISERDEGAHRQKLAVIRWLKSTVDSLMFGIEFITGVAQPVAIKIRDKMVEALLVSAAQMDTLITASGLYRNGEAIRLKLPHKEMTLQAVAGPLINRQGNTDQFRITRS